MKLRYFQPQSKVEFSNSQTGIKKVRWYEEGPKTLQYYTEEDGFWQDVETVLESEEALYDGERTMR